MYKNLSKNVYNRHCSNDQVPVVSDLNSTRGNLGSLVQGLICVLNSYVRTIQDGDKAVFASCCIGFFLFVSLVIKSLKLIMRVIVLEQETLVIQTLQVMLLALFSPIPI